MTDNDDVQHRSRHAADPDRVELREEGGEDGTFEVRMPIATTGEVRNQGDDPLSRDELEGMANQIDGDAIGVFVDHGRNPDIAGSRYSAVEKVGEWQEPDIQARDADDTDELVATSRMMDPETLPEATGELRTALSVIKEQAKRGLSLSSSIGWRDDDGYPGGVDLMETSIVGIGADPRTTSDGDATAAGLRSVVMGPEDERHLSSQQAQMAGQVLDAYRDEQGNGSVENFESWLWSARGQFDDNMLHAAMTGLEEFYRETTPLQEPVSEQYVDFLDERREGDGSDGDQTNDHDMSNDDSTDSDGGDPDGTQDGDQDSITADEFREQMLEMQRQQTETLNALSDSIRADDDEDEDDEDEDDDEDDDNEQSADPDDDVGGAGDGGEQRTVTVDGEEMDVDELVEDYERSRAAIEAGDVDLDDVDFGEQDVQTEADVDDVGGGEDTDADRAANEDDSTNGSAGWLN